MRASIRSVAAAWSDIRRVAAKNIGVGSLLAELTKRPVANYTRLSWGAVSIFLFCMSR